LIAHKSAILNAPRHEIISGLTLRAGMGMLFTKFGKAVQLLLARQVKAKPFVGRNCQTRLATLK
jgi:hypothetical protein